MVVVDLPSPSLQNEARVREAAEQKQRTENQEKEKNDSILTE
jgi:hypothetical protein